MAKETRGASVARRSKRKRKVTPATKPRRAAANRARVDPGPAVYRVSRGDQILGLSLAFVVWLVAEMTATHVDIWLNGVYCGYGSCPAMPMVLVGWLAGGAPLLAFALCRLYTPRTRAALWGALAIFILWIAVTPHFLWLPVAKLPTHVFYWMGGASVLTLIVVVTAGAPAMVRADRDSVGYRLAYGALAVAQVLILVVGVTAVLVA